MGNGGFIPNLSDSREGIFGILADNVLKVLFLNKKMEDIWDHLNQKEFHEVKNHLFHAPNELRSEINLINEE